jgi:hypothetical protein
MMQRKWRLEEDEKWKWGYEGCEEVEKECI